MGGVSGGAEGGGSFVKCPRTGFDGVDDTSVVAGPLAGKAPSLAHADAGLRAMSGVRSGAASLSSLHWFSDRLWVLVSCTGPCDTGEGGLLDVSAVPGARLAN